MPMAVLENKAGKYVRGRAPRRGRRRSRPSTLPDDMIVWASDPEAADAYPIVTYTWLICYKKYPDKNKLQAMQDLVKYGLTEGQKDAEALGYIPLPAGVVAKATAAVQNLDAPVASSALSWPRHSCAARHVAAAGRALRVGRPARSRRRRAARQMLDRPRLPRRAWRSPCLTVVPRRRSSSCGSPSSAVAGDAAATASDFSPAGSGIRTPSATASSPRSGARSTPRCWRYLGTVFGVAAAIFLSEGYLGAAVVRRAAPPRTCICIRSGAAARQLERLLKNLIELLAAIPSVVYGLWGIFVVIPLIRPVCNWLH